ncbi:hypothetical protein BC332_24782 [Capsicum chinense]|nr:hypothetical protein BC332_24782 [Capsicum chinense]
MATTEGEEMRQRAVELSEKIKSSVSDGGLACKEMESFISNIIKLVTFKRFYGKHYFAILACSSPLMEAIMVTAYIIDELRFFLGIEFSISKKEYYDVSFVVQVLTQFMRSPKVLQSRLLE